MGAESYLPQSPLPLPLPDPQVSPDTPQPVRPVHLVVVRTRPGDPSSPGEVVTRYWHPGRRTWQEQTFESVELALRLFVEEHGWELRQQQALEGARREELIFAAATGELDLPSAREVLLEEVGLTPEDAEAMLDRVDEGEETEP